MTKSSNMQATTENLSPKETHEYKQGTDEYDAKLKIKTYISRASDVYTEFRTAECRSDGPCEIKIALDMSQITKRELLYRLNKKSK